MNHSTTATHSPSSPRTGRQLGIIASGRRRVSRQGSDAGRRNVIHCKRGDVGEALQWIYRLTAAIILFWLLLAQIQMLTNFMKVPNHMELSLYQQRLLNGPDGIFAHEPTTGRVLVSVVDLGRFNNNTLKWAYLQDSQSLGARLALYRNTTVLKQQKPFLIAVQNPDLINKYIGLGQAGFTGPGGALYERHIYPIMIQLQADKPPIPGWLEVEAVKRT